MTQTGIPNHIFDPGRTNSVAAVTELRDRVMASLREHGEWYDDRKGHKLLCWETEQLRIAYAEPFRNKTVNLPHVLSVWSKSPVEKVLLIKWRDPGEVTLITYKRGDWEAQLP